MREHNPPSNSTDSLPLFRRSNSKITKDRKTTENGETTRISSSNNNNSMTLSSFHLLDNDTSGASVSALDDGRNVALGDGSGQGNRTYATLSTVTTKESLLLSDAEKDSKSSWILLQKGRIILLILAIVYGSLNISMRLVFARPDPPTASASSTIQGWFSVICFFPLLWRNQNSSSNTIGGWMGMRCCTGNHNTMSFGRFALELAIFNFGTQALINMSLVATQGARASFLVQMSVVFTPVLSVLFGHQKVSPRVWIGCFVALAGLFVLSYSEAQVDEMNDNSDNSPSLALSWGDWCCLLAALCWSLYIYRLSAWGEFFDETMTQFVKNIVLATLYTLWMLVSYISRQYYLSYDGGDQENGEAAASESQTDNSVGLWNAWSTDLIAWIILFYSALGPCTLADVFQQKAQSSVPAAETNVILSLEPVFTTLLGFLLLGEIPSLQEMCGGLLIMIASFIVSCGGPQQPLDAR